ncbi:MAG: hypothetical protein U1A78_16830 [Polyangia bacterium]
MDAEKIEAKDIERFYRGALLGLRTLEAGERSARRFGPEADARWRALHGELLAADRLELLLRDAAGTQPAAFAPRLLFELPGLPADEPFGREFRGADEALATELLRTATQHAVPASMSALLDTTAAIWQMDVSTDGIDPEALDALQPASRVVAAGAGAVVALARSLSSRGGFDLADQVTVVTESPGVRQLLGLAILWTRRTQTPRLMNPADLLSAPDPLAVLRERSITQVDLTVVTADATEAERAAVERLSALRGR